MNDDKQVQTAIRVPESALKLADKLAKKLSRPGMPATRTGVLRRALIEGLDRLKQGVDLTDKR